MSSARVYGIPCKIRIKRDFLKHKTVKMNDKIRHVVSKVEIAVSKLKLP